MATGRSTFAKRQRDMAKKARAEAKRQKRLERNNYRQSENAEAENETGVESENVEPQLSNAEIVAKVEELHRLYDDGQIDLPTFDEQKTALMSQISVG